MIRSCRSSRWLAGVLALAGLGLGAAGPWCAAVAKTLAGVTMPDTMTLQGQTLKLNGMGLRSFTILHIHGYVAGLYVADPSRTADAILAGRGLKLLQIRYVHAAGIGRVQEEFLEGRKLDCQGGCPKGNDAAFDQLFATARAVRPGDTTTYVYSPDGVQVLFNDQSLAMIRNADFARRMLDGMIGSHPPTAALRDGLLGG